MEFDIQAYLSSKKRLVDLRLKSLLRDSKVPRTKLEESIRYSALAGGKRLRPILLIAACETVGGREEEVLQIACAIEMIHTYSLIHDDLPSMDNDSLRRGVAANHVVFGEAIAILAGDALLTDAFKIIVREGRASGIAASLICDLILDISSAAGSEGMILGQAMDLSLEGNDDLNIREIEEMHSFKTGAMITVSVVAGARIGGASGEELVMLRSYAMNIGLAYQIVDDMLDIGDGRRTGKDRGAGGEGLTYTELFGVEKSRQRVLELTECALEAIKGLGDKALILRGIALYLGGRQY